MVEQFPWFSKTWPTQKRGVREQKNSSEIFVQFVSDVLAEAKTWLVDFGQKLACQASDLVGRLRRASCSWKFVAFHILSRWGVLSKDFSSRICVWLASWAKNKFCPNQFLSGKVQTPTCQQKQYQRGCRTIRQQKCDQRHGLTNDLSVKSWPMQTTEWPFNKNVTNVRGQTPFFTCLDTYCLKENIH